jgi:hypothetical protein
MLLEKLLQQPVDSPRLHLRDAVYGSSGRARLLLEVLGLANAETKGARHIFFGVTRDGDGDLQFNPVTEAILAEVQSYAELVRRYIEPDLKIEPLFGDINGNLVAAIEITRCNNPPYIVKTDVSDKLRRGDCWVRDGGLFRPAQRADFDRMYRETARNTPVNPNSNIVQVGFGNDPNIGTLSLSLPTVDRPPSSLAAARMKNEISARQEAKNVNVEDTGLARLVHARLYGNESPYEEQGINTLVEGYNAVIEDHADADNYYFFETQAVKVNMSLVNTGHQPLEDVSIHLILPWAEQFKVAERLYPPPGKKRSAKESELMGYPQVKHYKSAVQVKQALDFLEPDQVIKVFEQDLRIAVQPRLAGQKVAIRYSIHAKGFERPEEGKLKLVFTKT